MSQLNITIIGGGNLGSSLAIGLKHNSIANQLIVTKRTPKINSTLQEHNILTTTNNQDAVKKSNVVILAVKPYKIKEVLEEIRECVQPNTLIVSVATGITIQEIQEVVNKEDVKVFRAMPNTAAEVNESITCIATNSSSEANTETIIKIFDCIGKSIVIEEELMDAATVLGACGIAYVMRFVRAMVQGGIEIGFDSKTANLITTQTIKGAVELLMKNGKHPEEEIDKVTTPKGCTIAGLNEMEHQGFSSSMIKGIKTSFERI